MQVHTYLIVFVLMLAPALHAQDSGDEFTRQDYEAALTSGLYEEAGIAAKTRLEQAIRDGKVKELSTVELLDDLAQVQRLTGDYDTAIQNYELAVEIIESKRDMLDLALANPLLGLGVTYLESGRADIAVDHLQRALHVRSVNAGPHSIEQAETLEVLADAYRSMGELDKAADSADRLYLIYSRKYSPNSLELIPVILKKGHILGDIGEWRRQRNTYNDALDIARKIDGDSSVHAIRPQLSLGNSYVREYFDLYLKAENDDELPSKDLLDDAERRFEAASELVRDNASVDWQISRDALLAAGDFYTMTDEQSHARLMYRTAWDLLSGNEERLIERKRHLEQIWPLLQPEPDLTVALPEDLDIEDSDVKLNTGFVISQFTVTRRGKLRDIGLVEISPDRNERIEAEVKRALTMFVYRPRLELGTAVDTDAETIRFEFPYLDSVPVSR